MTTNKNPHDVDPDEAAEVAKLVRDRWSGLPDHIRDAIIDAIADHSNRPTAEAVRRDLDATAA